jgi:uncharacterized tellurite resistance protein B-like protein
LHNAIPFSNLSHNFSGLDYSSTIIGLYYLVIGADGKITDKEVKLGKKVIAAEGFDETKFEVTLNKYKETDRSKLYKDCLEGLKKLNAQKQIRCLSWMCVIANSDGFMDKREWELIYKIYHTELSLSLDEIMKTQRELNKILHGRDFISFGIKTE